MRLLTSLKTGFSEVKVQINLRHFETLLTGRDCLLAMGATSLQVWECNTKGTSLDRFDGVRKVQWQVSEDCSSIY